MITNPTNENPNPPLADALGSAYSPESAKATLEEVYQWLHDGPMDSWDMRCHLHRKIGDMLGKKRVEYHE